MKVVVGMCALEQIRDYGRIHGDRRFPWIARLVAIATAIALSGCLVAQSRQVSPRALTARGVDITVIEPHHVP